ncbi:zinc-finger domain-containing protein [Cupriavidus sp. AU9028]|uniref:zinc-finger domain-containing protein n=1 Tax=Cupriavidus sp. AU9028 TaxID=2871157 RepID=UPI001C95FDFB|nr:zinc-finger domain-containing protein [Cupriavidus sp. AU9028]MBY4895446.1 zinc-finger domain-containing protein [Cupriavidus sp. AU9028]
MTQTVQAVEIGAEDLPLHCPTPNTPAWNYHPRVFLDIGDTGQAKCPYCGTVYKLKEGVVLKGHH